MVRADDSIPTDWTFSVSLDQNECSVLPALPCAPVSGGGTFTTSAPVNSSDGDFLFITSLTGDLTIGGVVYQFSPAGVCSDTDEPLACDVLNVEGLDGESGPEGSFDFVFHSQILLEDSGAIEGSNSHLLDGNTLLSSPSGLEPVDVTLTPMPESGGGSLTLLGTIALIFFAIARPARRRFQLK